MHLPSLHAAQSPPIASHQHLAPKTRPTARGLAGGREGFPAAFDYSASSCNGGTCGSGTESTSDAGVVLLHDVGKC